MKSCPQCHRLSADEAAFCPEDGTALRSASQVPIAPSAADPRIGARLGGRYQLRRAVAEGGSGKVYEALDEAEGRPVAVKVLHRAVARDEIAVERFKRELEVGRQLRHEHIVGVHDFLALDDGGYALVLEYLEGEALRGVLRREGRVPLPRLVRLLSQAALALDEAHRRKLVHRDLKPDNLFLCGTREGDVLKVLDFGSVKDRSSPDKQLTMVGTTIGSPHYMAPEQAQGLDTLDGRADVFALGVIVYECLAGEVPFTGPTGPSILFAILSKEPTPLRERAPELPVSIDAVLERALAKDPARRFRKASELVDALGRACGLRGDHRAWARMPVAAIEAEMQCAAAAPARSTSLHRIVWPMLALVAIAAGILLLRS